MKQVDAQEISWSYEIWLFVASCIKVCHRTLSWARWIQSITLHSVCKLPILIFSSHTHLSLLNCRLKFCTHFSFRSKYIHCQFIHLQCNHVGNIKYELWRHFRFFLTPRSNYFSQYYFVSDTRCLMKFPWLQIYE